MYKSVLSSAIQERIAFCTNVVLPEADSPAIPIRKREPGSLRARLAMLKITDSFTFIKSGCFCFLSSSRIFLTLSTILITIGNFEA